MTYSIILDYNRRVSSIETDSKFVHFTSERGGIGRTTALANIAFILAKQGLNIGVTAMEASQSKLRRLLAVTNAPDGLTIGQEGGSIVYIPNNGFVDEGSNPKDVVLTEQVIPIESKVIELFFHRIDPEGINDAQAALQDKDKDRLILVPSMSPYDPPELRIERLSGLAEKHPFVASLSLAPYLFLVEELTASIRVAEHPLVQEYQKLADLIVGCVRSNDQVNIEKWMTSTERDLYRFKKRIVGFFKGQHLPLLALPEDSGIDFLWHPESEVSQGIKCLLPVQRSLPDTLDQSKRELNLDQIVVVFSGEKPIDAGLMRINGRDNTYYMREPDFYKLVDM